MPALALASNSRYHRVHRMTDKPTTFASEAQFIKVDESLGIVFGFAVVCMENGEPYIDLHDDHAPEEAMFRAAVKFAKTAQMSTDMHERDEDNQPVPDGEGVQFMFPLTTEIAKSMGIVTERTGLMVAMKPSPAVLAKFVDGTYTGFSIGGRYITNEEGEL